MTEPGEIEIDERLRTSVAGIWAAGDVAAGPAVHAVAQYQARLAIDDMFGAPGRTADYSASRPRSSPTRSSPPSA